MSQTFSTPTTTTMPQPTRVPVVPPNYRPLPRCDGSHVPPPLALPAAWLATNPAPLAGPPAVGPAVASPRVAIAIHPGLVRPRTSAGTRMHRPTGSDALWWLVVTAIGLGVVAILGWGTCQLRQAMVIVDWSESQRIGGSIYLDGRPLTIAPRGTLVFRCSPGLHEFRIAGGQGYEYCRRLDLAPGARETISPRWSPTRSRSPAQATSTVSQRKPPVR